MNEKDTENIIIIFPFIVNKMNEILIKGYMDEDYYKSLYRLKGLEKRVKVGNFEAFLNNFVSEEIKNPVYLDQEMKNFIITFIPKNVLEKINQILNEDEIYLTEENYVSAYSLLSFMKNNSIIDSKNLTVLKKLENYFDLKTELTEMNNKVFFLEKTDMNYFIKEIYNVGKELSVISLEDDLLKNLYLSAVKTMNNRLSSIDENIISDVDMNKLMGDFNEDIESELIKLSSKINISNQSTELTQSSTVLQNNSKKATSSEKIEDKTNNNKFILFIYLFIIIGVFLMIFLYFEIKPNVKKVELLCKFGLGKYALHLSEKIVMKKPNDYKSYIAMAKSYEAIGEYNSSISSYKKAMKLKEKGEIK